MTSTLTFTCHVRDHGADDYELAEGAGFRLTALSDRKPVGSLDYVDEGDVLHVVWVEVFPARRRQGIASALLDEARRLHPQAQGFDTNGFDSDSGHELWAGRDDCWERGRSAY